MANVGVRIVAVVAAVHPIIPQKIHQRDVAASPDFSV
jgi:hypothetical protein